MPLTKILDGTPFVGLAVTFVHTGFNASIEFEDGQWSPQEFGGTPSEAILKCIAKNTRPFLHYSDCAVNNAPALPVGPCDCMPPLLAPPPY